MCHLLIRIRSSLQHIQGDQDEIICNGLSLFFVVIPYQGLSVLD